MLCVGPPHQDGEALEAGTKKFEDLEFQQLERESSLEEERETISQQLLQERAEYHGSVAKRKVRKHLTDGRPSATQGRPYGGLSNMRCSVRAKYFTVQTMWSFRRRVRVSSIWRHFTYSLTAEATLLQEFNISFIYLLFPHGGFKVTRSFCSAALKES